MEVTGPVVVIEGTAYDPCLDSGRRGLRTEDDEFVYIENALSEGTRYRVTIQEIPAPRGAA